MIARADFLQHVHYHLPLLFAIGVRHVDDVQDQIGFDDLFQCCTKCGNELMRELADKTNRIRNENWKTPAQLNPANQGIERREEPLRPARRRSLRP